MKYVNDINRNVKKQKWDTEYCREVLQDLLIPATCGFSESQCDNPSPRKSVLYKMINK